MSSSAGRVLLIPKGAYSAGTAYTPLDYVTYTDGNTYQCIKDTTGHAPTDTTYWKIMVDNSSTLHTSDIANNLTTQTAGKVLDASQGYALNNSLAKQIVRTGVTASAGGTVRIPASGTDDRIATTSVVMPICDDNSGKPVKYTSCVVSAGYVTITMAEAISNKSIGVVVINQ